MKISKKDEKVKYFLGQLSDGKSYMYVRVVSFQPSLRRAMSNSLSKNETISVVGCQVRERRDGELEIRMNEGTQVQPTRNKFDEVSLVA